MIGFLRTGGFALRRWTAGLERSRVVLQNHGLLLLLLVHLLLVLEHMLGRHLVYVPGLRESKFADVAQEALIGLHNASVLQSGD